MSYQLLPLAQIQANDENPRLIKEPRFLQLVESLIEFPEMLTARPTVCDEDGVILGGNMRYKAKLHLVELPDQEKVKRIEHAVFHRGLVLDEIGNTVADATHEEKEAYRALLIELFYTQALPATQVFGWSPRQKQEFIIKDNASFGEWDWDLLANGEWPGAAVLNDWGLNVPREWGEEPEPDDLLAEAEPKPATMKITFTAPEQLQKAEIDIQELLDRKFPGAYFSVSAGGI